jgi:hypothetical protein
MSIPQWSALTIPAGASSDHKRRDEVPVMRKAERRRWQLFLCGHCIDGLYRMAVEKVAASSHDSGTG